MSSVRAASLALSVLVAACTIPDPTAGGDWEPTDQCNSNPWMCGSSGVCWPADNQGDYACYDVSDGGVGAKWSECHNAIGRPSCGTALACLKVHDLSSGYCVPYCDEAHPCASGEQCKLFRLVAPIQAPFRVCVPDSVFALPRSSAQAAADAGAK